jgi:hypothetical protein
MQYLAPKDRHMNPNARSRATARSARWTTARGALAICIALAASQALAQEGFIADKKGCKVSNPNPKADESVAWSGKCVDGYADGKGLLQWYVNGVPSTRYEGTLRGGLLAGQGKLTMPDGASYEGGWLAGKQEGKGVQAMPDGTRYEGEWKNGKPDGRGVLRNAAGETLEGEWSEGAYVGPGQKK